MLRSTALVQKLNVHIIVVQLETCFGILWLSEQALFQVNSITMMKGRKVKRRLLIIILALFCLSETQATERVESVLEKIGVNRGICVLVGDTDCELAIALAAETELVFYVQLARGQDVRQACRAADEAKLFGTRIFLGKGSPANLHIADNIADAVVVMRLNL